MKTQDNRSKAAANPSSDPTGSPQASLAQDLRRKAEDFARERTARTPDDSATLSPDEIRDTLHELRVHQIELEMQNEELRRAQAEIEAGRARYFDLYDLAPVGYCTVSEQGLILEANLTAATLLGTARSALVNRPLSQFIIKEDQDLYYLQRKQLFETGETRECELRLVKPDGSNFWAHLTATAAQAEDGAPLCRVVLSDITGRKQMEEDLRRSERLFRLDFEESPVGRCLIGLDGRFLMTNQAFCVLQGRSASELGGMSFLEVTHPEDHDASREGMRQLLDGTLDRFDLEKRYLVSEQRTVWASVRVGLIRDEAGEPLHFSLFVQDISERKLAEEALQRQVQRYDLVVAGVQDAIWDWDVPNKRVFFSPRWKEIRGYAEHEVSDGEDEWHRGIHPEDLPRVFSQVEAHFAGRTAVFTEEYRVRCKDGAWKWVLDRGIAQRSPEGRVVRMAGSETDITVRKLAEAKLLELKMAVEQSGDGIALAGLDGHIVFVNKAWAEMHGCAAADLIGQHLSVFHTPEQLENEVNPFNERVIATESNTGEMGHCRKDGTTFITQMAVTVVNDATGTPFRLLAAARDITERKQAEAEREKLQTQVLQAQKMQSVGLLAGGVAHDFNNMLGIILGHTELAMARVEPGGSLHADLAEIRMAAQCSADLTRQILAFARKQTITPKVLDLNDTVEGMLKMLRRLIGEEIDLDWKPGPGLCPVKMDPTQIDQILANLCINARDAISGVGKITVSTRNTALDEKSCARLGGGTPGEYVMLSVSDDGCGMDSETLLLIFDPFYTTKEIGKGTGLGLATVYGIVKQNQGFINASSEPGQGATFTIHLPRHAAGMEPDAGKAPDQAVSSGHETILVVEDEPALLKMATIVMESQGYTVLAAGCPAEAIRMAGEHAGRIDLLLTDVVMPGMNGRDLAKSLVSTYPGLKRLFMSGYTADIIARHGVMDEGAHFIQKPFSLMDLAAKLREALEE
jgi:two-component system cell cycle sensor histidine kinase/response regulator CckA